MTGSASRSEAWQAYRDRLGNLTEQEENAIRRAFLAGWLAGEYNAMSTSGAPIAAKPAPC